MGNKSIHNTSNTLQAFWVALGSLSSIGLSIVSAMILSRYFDKAELGTYKQILYVYSTLLIVFSAGLPRVFAYFLPRYGLEEGKDIVLRITKFLFFSGIVFSLFLFLFSDIIASVLKNEELGKGLRMFSPIPMLLLPTLGIEGIFSTYKKTQYIAIYNAVSRLIMLACIVSPVLLFGGSYIYAIYGWIVASLITLIIAYYFKNIPFKGVVAVNSELKYKEIFAYSLPLVTASLWGIAMRSSDQFYISRYFGAEVFAEFSNGFIELPFVAMVTSSTSVVLMPIFSKLVSKSKDYTELLSIWRNALEKSAVIIYPLVIYFIFYASEIMVLLYSEAYKVSGIYFQINMVLNFFNIIIFTPLLFSLGETKFYSRLHMLMAMLVWIGGYLMIIIFNSPVAIAICSVSLNILKVCVAVYFVSKKLNVNIYDLFPLKRLILLFIHNFLCASAVYIVTNNLKLFSNVLFEFIFSVVLYMLLILSTSKLFKLNYLFVLNPIFIKMKNALKI